MKSDPGKAGEYGRLAVGSAFCALALNLVWFSATASDLLDAGSSRTAVSRESSRIGTAQAADYSAAESGPAVRLRKARLVRLPGAGGPGSKHAGDSDSNNPVHWDGDTFYILNSAERSWRHHGPDLFHLTAASRAVVFDREISGGRWIESTWMAEDGTLYGWYHNEPTGIVSRRQRPGPEWAPTAPRIGAALSRDNGQTWQDLGIILEAPAASLRSDTLNHYFAGGSGDFSVIPDQRRGYFYFLFSTYHKEVAEQGVSIARMRYADRDRPVGKVWKWRQGRWAEPGLGGRVTPVFPAARDWHEERPDAFWGASIHWNTHLKQYVVLLNHAIDSGWTQEGIYVTFNPDLAAPDGWTAPRKILSREQIVGDPMTPTGWYPQVIGFDQGRRETDKRAGQVARLFMQGRSRWEILFLRPDEAAELWPAESTARGGRRLMLAHRSVRME